MTSIPANVNELKAALIEQWNATNVFDNPPIELAETLAASKYNDSDWLNKVP